jgi:CHRD domain
MKFCHRKVIVRHAIVAVLLTFTAAPAFAADLQYQCELDPVAFDNSTVLNTVGKGSITATLSGRVLAISGSYAGLSSNATAAHVEMGLALGVPGPVIGDVKVSGDTSGRISGSVTLNAAQIAALKQGGLSVVVDSAKAPDGNLWGWLQTPDQSQ